MYRRNRAHAALKTLQARSSVVAAAAAAVVDDSSAAIKLGDVKLDNTQATSSTPSQEGQAEAMDSDERITSPVAAPVQQQMQVPAVLTPVIQEEGGLATVAPSIAPVVLLARPSSIQTARATSPRFPSESMAVSEKSPVLEESGGREEMHPVIPETMNPPTDMETHNPITILDGVASKAPMVAIPIQESQEGIRHGVAQKHTEKTALVGSLANGKSEPSLLPEEEHVQIPGATSIALKSTSSLQPTSAEDVSTAAQDRVVDLSESRSLSTHAPLTSFASPVPTPEPTSSGRPVPMVDPQESLHGQQIIGASTHRNMPSGEEGELQESQSQPYHQPQGVVSSSDTASAPERSRPLESAGQSKSMVPASKSPPHASAPGMQPSELAAGTSGHQEKTIGLTAYKPPQPGEHMALETDGVTNWILPDAASRFSTTPQPPQKRSMEDVDVDDDVDQRDTPAATLDNEERDRKRVRTTDQPTPGLSSPPESVAGADPVYEAGTTGRSAGLENREAQQHRFQNVLKTCGSPTTPEELLARLKELGDAVPDHRSWLQRTNVVVAMRAEKNKDSKSQAVAIARDALTVNEQNEQDMASIAGPSEADDKRRRNIDETASTMVVDEHATCEDGDSVMEQHQMCPANDAPMLGSRHGELAHINEANTTTPDFLEVGRGVMSIDKPSSTSPSAPMTAPDMSASTGNGKRLPFELTSGWACLYMGNIPSNVTNDRFKAWLRAPTGLPRPVAICRAATSQGAKTYHVRCYYNTKEDAQTVMNASRGRPIGIPPRANLSMAVVKQTAKLFVHWGDVEFWALSSLKGWRTMGEQDPSRTILDLPRSHPQKESIKVDQSVPSSSTSSVSESAAPRSPSTQMSSLNKPSPTAHFQCVSPVAQPASIAPQPVSSTAQPTSVTPQPVSPLAQPMSVARQRVSHTAQPTSVTPQPVSPLAQPVSSTAQPVASPAPQRVPSQQSPVISPSADQPVLPRKAAPGQTSVAVSAVHQPTTETHHRDDLAARVAMPSRYPDISFAPIANATTSLADRISGDDSSIPTPPNGGWKPPAWKPLRTITPPLGNATVTIPTGKQPPKAKSPFSGNSKKIIPSPSSPSTPPSHFAGFSWDLPKTNSPSSGNAKRKTPPLTPFGTLPEQNNSLLSRLNATGLPRTDEIPSAPYSAASGHDFFPKLRATPEVKKDLLERLG